MASLRKDGARPAVRTNALARTAGSAGRRAAHPASTAKPASPANTAHPSNAATARAVAPAVRSASDPFAEPAAAPDPSGPATAAAPDPGGPATAGPPAAADAAAAAGESALDAMWPQVYEELRRLARRSMRGQGHEHTLEPTALVHEAYLKLSRSPGLDASDRARFLGLAARAMRQILVDHARGKMAVKRGDGGVRVELVEGLAVTPPPAVDLLVLHEALDRLAALDERKVAIIEMRYLAGLTLEEVAEVLGLSVPTIKRDAAMAKAWLFRELERS